MIEGRKARQSARAQRTTPPGAAASQA